MTQRLLVLALAGAALVGCASSDAFRQAKSAGDRAKSSGRYDEAAARYHDASLAAKRPSDRDEAAYLEAATLVQAGRVEEAKRAFEELLKRSPHGVRGDRAAFDRAFLEADTGDEKLGYDELERAIFARPGAGSSRRGLRRLVEHEEEKEKGGGLAWLDANLAKLEATELSEDAIYLRATMLRRAERRREAREEFVRCATKHGYPKGSLFDDAYWHAAELDLELGEPRRAIDDLERLLAPREASSLGQGSYERPRYSMAQLKIGEIYRDQLHDPAKARAAFRKLADEHKTSLLRDDALFAEALIARGQGDRDGACEPMRTLVRELPESVFSGCAREVCAELEPSKKAPPCREYLRARIDGRPPTPDEPPASE